MDFSLTPWWFYLVAVVASFGLVNGVPHFVQGISGKQFPSPFSGGPPNLDSAVNNVLWGGGNWVVGGLCLWLISPGFGNWVLLAELVGVGLAVGVMLAKAFSPTAQK